MLKRPLVFVTVSFILGIVFMNIKRTIFYMALLFLLSFVCFCAGKTYTLSRGDSRIARYDMLISKKELKKSKIKKIIMAMIIALILGYLYGNINYKNKVEYIKNIEGQEVHVSGVVINREESYYVLKNVYINNNKLKGKLKIKSRNEYEILEEMSSKVLLELPEKNMNFGGFNYRNYLYSKNIIAVGDERLYYRVKTKTVS